MSGRSVPVHSRWPHLLTSPGFLVALGLLVLNDRYLKDAYGNWFTGKLSDFAGVFALALFMTAWAPRWRTRSHLAVGVAFAAWKSPLATPLLDAWNALSIYPLARVIDPTDLVALMALPLSWWYAARARPIGGIARLRPIIAGVACLAFIATSEPRNTTRDGTVFDFPSSRDLLLAELRSIDAKDSSFHANLLNEKGAPAEAWISFNDRAEAYLKIERSGPAESRLTIVQFSAPERLDLPPSTVRRRLMDQVIDPLRRRVAAPPAGVPALPPAQTAP
jgi:hypothetical protein